MWGTHGGTVNFGPYWQQHWERISEPQPELFKPKPYEPPVEPYGGDWAVASGIGTISEVLTWRRK